MLVVTASEMAGLDRRTIQEIGIPGMVLMENAARGAADFYREVIPDLVRRRITVVAGGGNNAGDGFVLGRLFHEQGARIRVVCLRPPGRLQGDALTNFLILERIGVPHVVWDEDKDFPAQWGWIQDSDVVIDAILGTGLKSEVQGTYRRIIEGINGLGVPVLAVDIPSGLDATSGRPLGAAVRATATATFGFPKTGHFVEPGCEYTGALKVVDIGIPASVVKSSGISRWWLTEEFVSRWIAPRTPSVHKGHAGHVGVLAGSRGKTGAAALVCLGAARAGAGLITLFIPSSLNSILEVKITEPMTLPIPETDEQSPAINALPHILDFMDGKQAMAVGPGISLHPQTCGLVKELVQHIQVPMVLDADAITALADDPRHLQKASPPVVLTPHPGEMARISKKSTQAVQEDRIEAASGFSKEHGVVVVLKGFRTVIAAPDGRLAINSTGNPAMAGGGTGDTLTGIIAALLAQQFEPFQAACLGAFIHGAAADRCLPESGTRGLIASDLLQHVPVVIGQLESLTDFP